MSKCVRKRVFALVTMLTVACQLSLTVSAGPVNKNDESIAIDGYDTVAYFTMGEPHRGKAEYSQDWQGAEWRFLNAEHRDMFVRDPDRYAPRYGGFCAGGMALGMQAPVDPEAWTIVDDQLYLSYDKEVRDELAADPLPTITKADRNWSTLEAPSSKETSR